MTRTLLCWSAFAALGLCSLAGHQVAGQQFVTPSNLKINSSTPAAFGQIIGFGDFNSDGRRDIVVVYTPPACPPFCSRQYALLLGNSDGSYTPVLTGIFLQHGGESVQVADVNGDGRLDILLCAPPASDANGGPLGSSVLKIFLGRGDGTFRPLLTLKVSDGFAQLVLVGDVNKDGKRDLIIEDSSNLFNTDQGKRIIVWTNDGAGNFTAAFKLPILPNNGSHVLAARDFRHIGYPDIVLKTNKGLQIFLNGNGIKFTPGVILPVNASLVATGDINHDNNIDLAVVDDQAVGQGLPPIGHILLGNGDGTFRMGTTFTYAPNPTGPFLNVFPGPIFITDVNGDSNPDIAVAVGNLLLTDNANLAGFSSELQIFLGNGDGTVGFPTVLNTGFATPILVDLNGDNKADLLMYAFPTYSFAANDGKGNFAAPHRNLVQLPDSILAADFNKDGIDDIAVVSDALTKTTTGAVIVFPGTGKGYLANGKSYSIGMPSGILAAGDVNGDGKIDLVVARSAAYLEGFVGSNTTDLSVLLGNGDGTFKPGRNFTVLGAPATGDTDNFAILADVNRDGKLDLIGDWGVALGKGDGTFAAPIPLPTSIRNVNVIASGDFNRDGVLDLAVGTSVRVNNNPPTATLYTLLGNGKGAYTVKGEQQLANTDLISAVAVADMNGDGKPDLIFDSSQFVNQTSSANLTVRLGNGDGTFGLPINYPLEGSAQILISDFNRDGKPDVLFLGAVMPPGTIAGGDLTLLFGIGGGKFSATPQYYPTTLQQGVVVDLNKDGAPDVVGTTPTGVTRLLNTGSTATVTK